MNEIAQKLRDLAGDLETYNVMSRYPQGLLDAADAIDAQAAEIAAQARHANFLNAEIARLHSRIAELREALNCTWMALEGYLPDHRNDVTDRAVTMARAALQEQPK